MAFMMERVHKIIAQAGIASRRHAELLIKEGRVSVNDVVVIKLGTVADPSLDKIKVDGKIIAGHQKAIYIMLHKPAGYVTTLSDPEGRPIVTDLLAGIQTRVYPVGRLDYDSEGLLLLTNDGAMAHRMMHPSFSIPRTYRVKVKGSLSEKVIRTLAAGVILADGPFKPLEVTPVKVNRKSTWLSITVHEGRNRIIRRALAALDYPVVRLIRTKFGSLELGDLPRGRYRFLDKKDLPL